TSLDRFSFSNILVYQTDDFDFEPITLPNRSDSLEISFGDHPDVSFWNEGLPVSLEGRTEAHIFTQSLTTAQMNPDSVITRDTTISSRIRATINASAWSFRLSFKEGSLAAYVAKTRNRNLAISFGILLILGISGGMIVMFSYRSRQLAEQQMLFVAGVSHELRTPLTVIRSAAENLSEGVIQSENRKKEYADLMLKEGRRLSDMVDQIMEFSGIQTGKKIYNFGKVEVQTLIQRLQDEVVHLLLEKDMKLELSNLANTEFVHADGDALFLAISNLLKNAVKFSDQESTIILKLEDEHLKSRPALQVEVQDFGIGIPEDELHEIFKPFFRGKKPIDEQVKGNGIGLNLVKRVAEAHQGEVSVKSKVGEGSTFRFKIPVSNE
ncbi:MAG: HAMP domain-containing histidine kinase, partial [Balneolales bacterium]|nr:HAMP domain-containing histidine kinase [Balneolales bacterium]